MKLFVSDLDGTLLNSKQQLSKKTLQTVNHLIDKGMNFSFATARSVDSAAYIIKELDLRLPVIVHNGVFIYDPVKKENLVSTFLDANIAAEILELYREAGISPFVYTVGDDLVRRAYFQRIGHPGAELYLNDRLASGDKRFTKVNDLSVSLKENIINILTIGDSEKLDPLYQKIKRKYDIGIHYAVDIYSHACWLELSHKKANKREALKKLKEIVQADKLICFGDHLNDIPMFEIADKKYAVENAQDALKKIADEIIPSNDNDGVAACLKKWVAAK